MIVMMQPSCAHHFKRLDGHVSLAPFSQDRHLFCRIMTQIATTTGHKPHSATPLSASQLGLVAFQSATPPPRPRATAISSSAMMKRKNGPFLSSSPFLLRSTQQLRHKNA